MGNREKLTRRGHPNHTRVVGQTKHQLAINALHKEHEVMNYFIPILSQR